MEALGERAVIDTGDWRLAIRTFAEGFFSPLAHDLEIRTREIRASTADGALVVRVPVPALYVAGVVRRGAVDPAVLKDSDRREIERRIREHVFMGVDEVTVRAPSLRPFRLEVSAGSSPIYIDLPLRAQAGDLIGGTCELSLSRLGLPEVRGPLNAFRVSDRVQVDFAGKPPEALLSVLRGDSRTA